MALSIRSEASVYGGARHYRTEEHHESQYHAT
jgi:hypothetical protein